MDQARSDEHEKTLIERATAGDLKAIHAIVESQLPSIYAIAKSLAGNPADAEDLVQETFLAGVDGLTRFRAQSSLRTWLISILMKQVAAWRRREKVRRTTTLPEVSDKHATGSALAVRDSSGNADIRMDLNAALDSLSSEYREVLVLRELGGLSYDEIAAALKVPRGTVESRIHRARLELRQHMKGYA